MTALYNITNKNVSTQAAALPPRGLRLRCKESPRSRLYGDRCSGNAVEEAQHEEDGDREINHDTHQAQERFAYPERHGKVERQNAVIKTAAQEEIPGRCRTRPQRSEPPVSGKIDRKRDQSDNGPAYKIHQRYSKV